MRFKQYNQSFVVTLFFDRNLFGTDRIRTHFNVTRLICKDHKTPSGEIKICQDEQDHLRYQVFGITTKNHLQTLLDNIYPVDTSQIPTVQFHIEQINDEHTVDIE